MEAEGEEFVSDKKWDSGKPRKRVHEEGRVHEGHGWLTGLTGLVELDRDISLSLATFFPPLSSFSLFPMCQCTDVDLGATSVGKVPCP